MTKEIHYISKRSFYPVKKEKFLSLPCSLSRIFHKGEIELKLWDLAGSYRWFRLRYIAVSSTSISGFCLRWLAVFSTELSGFVSVSCFFSKAAAAYLRGFFRFVNRRFRFLSAQSTLFPQPRLISSSLLLEPFHLRAFLHL